VPVPDAPSAPPEPTASDLRRGHPRRTTDAVAHAATRVLSGTESSEKSRHCPVISSPRLETGPPWVAKQAYQARPFADIYDLRKAFDRRVMSP
jgi:hypothetical protein